jgi:DNA polymerase-4
MSGSVGQRATLNIQLSQFVAKVASDMEKPDGLTVVPTGTVREFLDPLPIKKMWGVSFPFSIRASQIKNERN